MILLEWHRSALFRGGTDKRPHTHIVKHAAVDHAKNKMVMNRRNAQYIWSLILFFVFLKNVCKMYGNF